MTRRTLTHTAPYILFCELCERLTAYGISTNIVTYLRSHLRYSTAESAETVQLWTSLCYLMPLAGAYVADAGLGRYRTILRSCCVYVVGSLALTYSSWVVSPTPTQFDVAILNIALLTIAAATGGVKANVSAFGADQFGTSEAEVKDSRSFFNYFYLSINVGSLLASLVIIPIQSGYSWTVGFAIPTVSMIGATITLVCGAQRYRHESPTPGPLGRVVSVIWNSVQNRSAQLGAEPMPQTPFRWLSRADMRYGGSFSPSDVAEARALLRISQFLGCCVAYQATYSQMGSFFVLQGAQMDTRVFGVAIPAAALSAVNTVTIVCLVPVFDKVLYPWLDSRRLLTQQRKVSWGFLVAATAMLCAAALEAARRAAAASYGSVGDDPLHPAAPMSVLWQAPQYGLVGISEIFANIGQLELCYKLAPRRLRSCCMALQLLTMALGSGLSVMLTASLQAASGGTFITEDLNQGHLDLLFVALAGMMAAAYAAFLRLDLDASREECDCGEDSA